MDKDNRDKKDNKVNKTNRSNIINFRLDDKELDIFNNKVNESGLSKTDYIIGRIIEERPVSKVGIAAGSCAIRREIDVLEEKLIRTGEISVEDLSGIKKEMERRWR